MRQPQDNPTEHDTAGPGWTNWTASPQWVGAVAGGGGAAGRAAGAGEGPPVGVVRASSFLPRGGGMSLNKCHPHCAADE